MLFQMRFRMLFTLLLSLIVPAGSASADMRFNFENCYKMAFQYNHYYEIYNYSSGKYVNLNGDHENDVVNNGEKVTM